MKLEGMTLEEAKFHVGKKVAYTPYEGALTEVGRIHSVGESYVFVGFNGQIKACYAHTLELTFK